MFTHLVGQEHKAEKVINETQLVGQKQLQIM